MAADESGAAVDGLDAGLTVAVVDDWVLALADWRLLLDDDEGVSDAVCGVAADVVADVSVAGVVVVVASDTVETGLAGGAAIVDCKSGDFATGWLVKRAETTRWPCGCGPTETKTKQKTNVTSNGVPTNIRWVLYKRFELSVLF